MHKLFFLILIIFQLATFNVVYAQNELNHKEFNELIKDFNAKNFTLKDVSKYISEENPKLSNSLLPLLNKFEVSKVENEKLPQIIFKSKNEFSFLIQNKPMLAKWLNDDQFELSYEGKKAIVNLHQNTELLIEALAPLNLVNPKTSFSIQNLFIDSAQAAFFIPLIVIVVLALAGIYAFAMKSKNAALEVTLKAKSKTTLALCESLKEDNTMLEFQEASLNSAFQNLMKYYNEKCTFSKETCAQVKKAVECLDGLTNKSKINNSSRASSKDSSESSETVSTGSISETK